GEKVPVASDSLQNRIGIAANTGNLRRFIGRSRSARNLIAPSLQKRTSKGARHDHLSHRVSQTFGAEVGRSHRADTHRHVRRAPPRDPTNDDEDEDEDEEDEDQPDQPAVARTWM